MNREEIALVEAGHTEISRVSARVLVALFVVTLLVVPGVQVAQWAASAFSPAAVVQFPMLRSLLLPARAVHGASVKHGSLWTKLKAGNRAMLQEIAGIEDDLGEVSVVGNALRPLVQEALVKVGWGTEQVRVGKQGWLFYEPAVEYLAGDGFLDPEYQARRVSETPSWLDPPSCNPLPAILDFADQLERRGIELILVPAPVKAGVVPDMLSRHAPRDGVLHNPSWPTFLDALERAGVTVQTVDETLQTVEPAFLKTDTHWTWQAADAVARRLADRLRTLGVSASSELTEESAVASNHGDLSQMLPLVSTSLFPAESVGIHPVLGADSGTSQAPVLLLGDSFSNIYSDNALGWGARAGLPERLAWHLKTPVTSIVRNNDGAFATRLELVRRLAQNPAFLDGIQYVVWEFTERELSFGDWRPLDLVEEAAVTDAFIDLKPGDSRRIRAVIAGMGEVPDPNEAAYADYLIALHLVEVQSDDGSSRGEALVFVWAMRDYELTPGAHHQVGDEVTMLIRPWSDVSAGLDTITRGEIFDERLLMQSPCWGESVTE